LAITILQTDESDVGAFSFTEALRMREITGACTIEVELWDLADYVARQLRRRWIIPE